MKLDAEFGRPRPKHSIADRCQRLRSRVLTEFRVSRLDLTASVRYARTMKHRKNPAAVALGRKGGKAIAERGPEYFRQLQAKRKNRKGGRPPKEKADT
ncbi:MAG: hypothetical protein DMG27_18870 [Acidobacteria bacterium]|nr:MAG: hypothetical protein DMG27_18870 [Acidobacteriota bacterium]